MYETDAETYFELALDLPERQRGELLQQLEREQPEVARKTRALLSTWVGNGDFATQSGVSASPAAPEPDRTSLDVMHHVALQVADIDGAVNWYSGRFQCQVEYQDSSWAMLRFANMRLALVLPGQHPSHVALLRKDASDFGTLSTHRDGTRYLHVSDPWGNSIEVLDKDSVSD
ncbi:MAG: VOC family protein [Planctomycetota bacterium]|jgi:hypothetical protein